MATVVSDHDLVTVPISNAWATHEVPFWFPGLELLIVVLPKSPVVTAPPPTARFPDGEFAA